MSIKKSLKNLIIAMGGTPKGRKTEDLIDEIAALKDPLFNLSFDVDIDESEDLLGKVVSDLQENAKIKDGIASGKLFFVDDYTGFSGDPELQSGHYFVVHAEVPDVSEVTISVSKDGGETTKNLDSDGILVFRTTSASQVLTFTASKSGFPTVTKELKLSGLKLEDE